MQDAQSPKIRERIWVKKLDKTYDPPRVIEEVFIENGQLVERTVPKKKGE